MKRPNLSKIIQENLEKDKFQSKTQPSLPKGGWLDQYMNTGGTYISDRAQATQFGQYRLGGGMFPEYHSYAPPRHAMGGQTGDPNQPYHPITNPDGYHPQNVLEKIKKLPNKNKPYEPSQMVNNAKALLAGTDLATGFSGNPYAQAGNFLARLANSTGDAYTAARYAMDGQWGNAGVDAGESLLDLIPFRKGKNVINLSKTNGLPGTYNKLSKLDKSLNNGLKAAKAGASADDFMHSSMGKFLFGDPDSQVKYKDGGLLSRTVTCFNCGHSWDKSDSSKKDATVCHICGKNNMKDGGWLSKYQYAGTVIPGVTDFKMPLNRTDATGRNIQEQQRQDAAALEIQRRNNATAKRQFVGTTTPSTPKSEARRIQLNKLNTTGLPNAQIDQFGNTSAVNPNMTYEGQPANFMGERQQKGYEHVMGALDAAGYVTGAAELAGLGYKGLKGVVTNSMESGLLSKYTKLPKLNILPNVGEIKPFTNFAERNSRVKDAWFDQQASKAGVPKTPTTADEYRKMLQQQKLQQQAGDFLRNIGAEDATQGGMWQAPKDKLTWKDPKIGETIYQLDASDYGNFKTPELYKEAQMDLRNFKRKYWQKLIDQRNANVGQAKQLGIFGKQSGYDPKMFSNKNLIGGKQFPGFDIPDYMENLGADMPMYFRDPYGSVYNVSGIEHPNQMIPYKGLKVTEGLSPNKFGGEQLFKQKKGGMITDPMGQWKYPGMNTRIPGGNITMQGVSYPVLAKANNGMTTMMYPGQEYNFPGASHVDEYPIMQNGGWLSKYQKAQDGVEYTGPSIVDYLATRGYSGKKAFRKKLAEKYDVEDYNFSADKNLELLAKLRENDDMLEQDFKPTQTPIPMEKLLEMEKEQATYKTVPKVQYDKKTSAPSIVNTIVKVKQPAFDAGAFNARLNLANMNFNPITSPNRQFLQNRMSWTPTASVPDVQQTAPQQPTDSIPQGMNPAVLNMMLSTQRPMNQTSAVNIPNNPFGSITGGGAQQSPEIQQAQSYVDNGFRAPYVQPIQNPYKFDNRMFTGKKSKTISVADMYPEINNQQSAGQFIAPNYVMPKEIGESTMTPDNVRQKMIEHIVTNNIRVTKTPDDLTDKVLKGDWINIGKDVFKKVRPIIETISPDLAIQGDSYFKRQDLKNNDTLQETKTKLTLPVETSNSISPAIITGDTVRLPTPDIKDRYIIPSQIDLKQTSWGIRNRGDYTPIDTEGGDITLFNNFVPANEYFKTNTVSDDASFIGVDNQGKVVTGKKKDFINSNIPISKTYSNKIVDFPTDANGKLQLKPSSPKASNKHLSPVTLNLDENGKQIKGSINLLIPKKNKSTDSFGDITGGRVIFTSPDGKESVFASGSADDIVTVFKNLKTKGNYPYLTAYTLDNGTYGPGLRKTSGKITSEDLKAYQGKNATGSVFLYLKNGNYSRASKNTETPILKYKDINMTTPNIRTEKDESYKKGHPLVNEQSAIVLHHTGYSDTTGISQGQSKAMKGVMDQFSRPGESSHVVIDFNGIRYNYARPDQVTFHAGKSAMNGRENVNDFGIGIEFQGDTDNKPLTDNQIESFVEYIAPIIKDKRIPLKNIITHKQIRSDYMKVHPEDKQVLGKPDVNERDYNRIKQALIKKGIYQEPIKKKKLGGVVNIGDKMDVTEEQLEQLKKQGYKFNIV